MTEEQKLKMAEGRAKKKLEKEQGNPPKGTGKPPAVGEFAELGSKMDKMVEGLNSVGSAVLKLVEMQSKPAVEISLAPGAKIEGNFTPKLEDETYPQQYVPPKYRAMVDKILSEEFGVRVVDFEDRTEFQLDIIVPERFSSVTKEDRLRGVEDIRTRIIPRAMGENGVREWCELIRRNLNKFYAKEGVNTPFTNAL